MALPSCFQLENVYSERKFIMLFAPQQKGQGLVEYAIILALVAIVVVAVVRLIGPRVGNTFSNINSQLP
jgi:pilus assembly protein Flp/PilA